MADAYCLCRKPYEPNEFMIECEVCKEWFHGRCVGIQEHQATEIEIYHCPKCQVTNGPLTLKKRRNSHLPDCNESSDNVGKIVQTGTVSFVHELKRRTFPSADRIPVIHLSGHEITREYFERNGFDVPILVDRKDGLDLLVPPANFTIQDVENYVGSMREIDVIDVARQEDCKMLMREWTEYYNSPDRRKIYNVISLEFSNTSLAKIVAPPRIVTELSWVNKYWQMALSIAGQPLQQPEVHRYCLMGVKDSFTDFHIDFGGTSVWYHVLRGEKVFYVIRPTPANMALYERWLSSSNQSEMFFGDQVDACYKCLIKQGQTLFIPTGWIHAVLTPIDSLVFGGNFLHDFNIELQLKVYEIERRVKTEYKYLFPCYETLHWYAAKAIVETITVRQRTGAMIPLYLVTGAKALFTALKSWVNKKDPVRQSMIPATVQHNKLLKDLQKLLKDLSSNTKGKDLLEKNVVPFPSLPAGFPNASSEQKAAKLKRKRKSRSPDVNRITDSVQSPTRKNAAKTKPGIILRLGSKAPTANMSPQKLTSPTWNTSQPFSTSSDFAPYDFVADDELQSNHDPFSPTQKSDLRLGMPFVASTEKSGLSANVKTDAMLTFRMVGGRVTSCGAGGGDNTVGSLSSPSSITAPPGFQLLGSKTPGMQHPQKVPDPVNSDEEEALVVDESPAKSRTTSTTIKPASLKLKFSVTKPSTHMDLTWSTTTTPASPSYSFPRLASTSSSTNQVNANQASANQAPADFAHRLAMPLIRGGLNSSISDILEVSGYGTETDIKIDDDIGRASPTMRDAIQGMLSMSQMGRTSSLGSTPSLLSSSTKSRLAPGKSPKYDDFELEMPTCYKDDEFVYPTLDISDNEEDFKFKSQSNSKQDEAWNPKGAKLTPNRPKPDRPKRQGTKKESVECGLAAAAAKFLNRPPPKRQYNRKKPKLEKKLSLPSPSTDLVPSTSTSAISSPGSNAVTPAIPSSPSKASSVGALSSDKSAFLKCKKPKKGMATAKQRLAQKLKMHKMLF